MHTHEYSDQNFAFLFSPELLHGSSASKRRPQRYANWKFDEGMASELVTSLNSVQYLAFKDLPADIKDRNEEMPTLGSCLKCYPKFLTIPNKSTDPVLIRKKADLHLSKTQA